MRVGKALRTNLELILFERDITERKTIEKEEGKLGHVTSVFSSDKIINMGLSKEIFRNDHARVVAECQQLFRNYGIICDVIDIAPEVLHNDGVKCDLLVYIKELQVFGSMGYIH